MQGTDMTLYNVTRDKPIIENMEVARSLMSRCIGLIGRKTLAPGAGLWLTPCNGIHTFLMRFAIDVITLDAEMRVLRIDRGVKPCRFVWPVRGGKSTVEMAVGTASSVKLAVGDKLSVY